MSSSEESNTDRSVKTVCEPKKYYVKYCTQRKEHLQKLSWACTGSGTKRYQFLDTAERICVGGWEVGLWEVDIVVRTFYNGYRL